MPTWQAILAASYAATSLVLFLFPNLLHRRKVYSNEVLSKMITSDKLMRISHRGGPRQATQNTIEAFEKVLGQSDGLELDICETKDGVLVVHHDAELTRTCGIDKNIGSLNYNQLPRIQKTVRLDFIESMYRETNCQKIPTLQELFEKFPQVLMNIELKTPSETAQAQMVRLIRKYHRQDKTLVGFRGKNAEFKKKNPDLLTFFNYFQVFGVMMLFYTGLLPFVPLHHNAFEIPIYTEEYFNWKLDIFGPKDSWKAYLMFKPYILLNLTAWPVIWHLRRRGIVSIGWVCNTRADMEKAQRTGVQAIMSDEPTDLDLFAKEVNSRRKVE